jgi:hypothetical protein
MNAKDQAIRSLSDGERLIQQAFSIARETLFLLREINVLYFNVELYGITYFVNDDDDLETKRKELASQIQDWEIFRIERITELRKAQQKLDTQEALIYSNFTNLSDLQRLGYAKVKAFELTITRSPQG